MPKAILYFVAAVADIFFAIVTYRNGRVILPAILVFAALCFIIATVGQIRTVMRSKHTHVS